jgi:ornithine cyclodeaminase/alanine dehydrogenase-like protein (mu-crystallin family)
MMKILVAGHRDVEQLLSMQDCIRAMEEMFIDLTEGRAQLPVRSITQIPRQRRSVLAVMPAFKETGIGAKVMTIYPENSATRFETHQGAVLLFDSASGALLAVVDSTSVTSIRTAAVSALATRLLARVDSANLAILGSGAQAYTHLKAIPLVRNIKASKIWSRNFERAKSLSQRFPKQRVTAVETAKEAVEDADIICTTTSSTTPILLGRWIKKGTHINAIGAFTKTSRELDSEAVRKSLLFVDRVESARAESGDYLIPKSQGLIRDSHIRGELGDLVSGKVKGRTNKKQITLFKSLGLATEDLAAAEVIYSRAMKARKGKWVEFGKQRDVQS